MNITTIRRKNDENGFTFFDPERLKLTKAKVHPEVYSSSERHLFILECDDLFRRTYEIIYFDVQTGFCGRLEGTIGYSSLADAKRYATKLTPTKKKTRTPTKKKSTKTKGEPKKKVKNEKKKNSLKPKRKRKNGK